MCVILLQCGHRTAGVPKGTCMGARQPVQLITTRGPVAEGRGGPAGDGGAGPPAAVEGEVGGGVDVTGAEAVRTNGGGPDAGNGYPPGPIPDPGGMTVAGSIRALRDGASGPGGGAVAAAAFSS